MTWAAYRCLLMLLCHFGIIDGCMRRTLNMTEHQQEAWIYTFERIALVQTILNGGAAALVAALKAEESYMLRQIYDDITYVPPGITLQDACQNMCDKAKHLNISIWFDYCGVALWATPATEPEQLTQLYTNKQRTT